LRGSEPRVSESDIQIHRLEESPSREHDVESEAIRVDIVDRLRHLHDAHREIVGHLGRSCAFEDLLHSGEPKLRRDVDVGGSARMLQPILQSDAAFEEPDVGSHMNEASEDTIERHELPEILIRSSFGYSRS